MAEHDKKPKRATDKRRGTLHARAKIVGGSNNGAGEMLGIFNDRRRPNGKGKRAK
jgi:hypothetical protein